MDIYIYMDTRYQICQVVPLINVGCRKKLANDDFEKNAPVCFLICRKKGYVFKIIRKHFSTTNIYKGTQVTKHHCSNCVTS